MPQLRGEHTKPRGQKAQGPCVRKVCKRKKRGTENGNLATPSASIGRFACFQIASKRGVCESTTRAFHKTSDGSPACCGRGYERGSAVRVTQSACESSDTVNQDDVRAAGLRLQMRLRAAQRHRRACVLSAKDVLRVSNLEGLHPPPPLARRVASFTLLGKTRIPQDSNKQSNFSSNQTNLSMFQITWKRARGSPSSPTNAQGSADGHVEPRRISSIGAGAPRSGATTWCESESWRETYLKLLAQNSSRARRGARELALCAYRAACVRTCASPDTDDGNKRDETCRHECVAKTRCSH
eukprot:6214269-Pleurochrysis_carterae.AAC.5